MGTRFIHKNGRVIPVHSDHGDQPQSGGEHATAQNAPNTPAPVAGKEEHNHPAPMAVAPVAVASSEASAEKPRRSRQPQGIRGTIKKYTGF